MSEKQVRQFIERMKTDEAFRMKMMSVADVTERLHLAKAEGYDLAGEDLRMVWTELGVRSPEESSALSDTHLGTVSGGYIVYQ